MREGLGVRGVLVLLGMLSALPGVARAQPSMGDLVGGYAEWVKGRGKEVDFNAADLDTARRELARMDPSAIPTDPALSPAAAREYQRRVLTTFALEMAAAGSLKHASAAERLVEWACAYVRSHTPLNDFDRAWQLAALSVLEGGIDSRALGDHVSHALPIFRDEPRLTLARGIVEEQFSAPNEALVRTVSAAGMQRLREAISREEGEAFRASERAIARFQEAEKDDTLRAEAMLRAGHVQLRLGRYDAALATWKGVEERTNDPVLLFLLYLFRGIAYENRGRLPEARAAYQVSLKISPGAHSASMRLAALGFRNGRDEESSAIVEKLLKTADPRRDPWWSYYAADWRFWYPRIEKLRTFLR